MALVEAKRGQMFNSTDEAINAVKNSQKQHGFPC